jgi:Domain of unknown function (DUF4136)
MIKSVLAGVLITMLISCMAMEVTTDFDPSVDFSVFKTYRWAQLSADREQGYSGDYKFLDARIREAVDRQLATKGYAPPITGIPDFLVSYQVWLETKISDDEYAQWGNWAHRIGPVDEARRPSYTTYGLDSENSVRQQDEGNLLLIISDGNTNRILWRGSAQTRVIKSETQKAKEKKINEAVRRILVKFPPK